MRAPDHALRPSTSTDIAASSDLHRRVLPDGFFVALGPRFLAAYHQAFIDGPYGIAVTAVKDGRVVGFVVGSSDSHAHQEWLLRRRGPRVVRIGIMALVRRPRTAGRFARTRLPRYGRATGRALRIRRRPSSPRRSGTVAVLSHIAVEPDLQGRGMGAELVEAFVESCRTGGADRIELVTSFSENGAAAFYDRLLWQRVGELRDADGRRFLRFSRALP